MTSLEQENKDLEESLLANDELNETDPSPSEEKTLLSIKGPIFALVFCIQAGAFIQFSFLPYVAFMSISLVPGLNEQTAGTYSGIFSAMSAFGKTVSAYFWGRIADRYGRKTVFYLSFSSSIVFSILFGFSTNITMALIVRFLLGASNNATLVVRTMCSELACGDKQFEGRIMGFVMGSFGWIGLYAPLISGFLSDPVKQFPHSWLSTHFHDFFTEFPFLLPNIASAILCSLAILAVYFFIPETEQNNTRRKGTTSWKAIWSQPKARDHVIAMWIFSFSGVFVSEAAVLFYLATDGGLSLQENMIGTLLATVGVIYVLIQYRSFKAITENLGVYKSMRLASLLSIPLVIFLPISLLLNQGQAPNTLSALAFLYLILLQGSRRIFGSTFMSLINLSVNRSVDPTEVASINAMSMAGSSLLQMISPVCAGFLTSYSLSNNYIAPSVGIFLVFGVVSSLGLSLFTFVSLRLKKYHGE